MTNVYFLCLAKGYEKKKKKNGFDRSRGNRIFLTVRIVYYKYYF